MDRAAIIDTLRSNERRLRSLGVGRLALFGSRARGTDGRNSDLDVLIDLTSELDHSDRIAKARAQLLLSGTISEITGFDISLVDRKELSPEFAKHIGRDLVEVF